MKIPHYDEHGQPLGQVDVDLPERHRSRAVHVTIPPGASNQTRPTRPVLPGVEPIADVRMHDLPAEGAHLGLVIGIAVACVAAFGALMWMVLSR
jgi:hypothetical protein